MLDFLIGAFVAYWVIVLTLGGIAVIWTGLLDRRSKANP
jgi:hypothetical protein